MVVISDFTGFRDVEYCVYGVIGIMELGGIAV